MPPARAGSPETISDAMGPPSRPFAWLGPPGTPPTARGHCPRLSALPTPGPRRCRSASTPVTKENLLAEQQRDTHREYVRRESHYVWGKRYLLSLVEQHEPPSLSLGHSTMTLLVPPGADFARRHEIAERWYRKQLRQAVPELPTADHRDKTRNSDDLQFPRLIAQCGLPRPLLHIWHPGIEEAVRAKSAFAAGLAKTRLIQTPCRFVQRTNSVLGKGRPLDFSWHRPWISVILRRG